MKDNDEVRNYINNNEDFKFKYYDLYSIINYIKEKIKKTELENDFSYEFNKFYKKKDIKFLLKNGNIARKLKIKTNDVGEFNENKFLLWKQIIKNTIDSLTINHDEERIIEFIKDTITNNLVYSYDYDYISELLVILKENHGINLSDIIYIVIINLNNKDIVKEGLISLNAHFLKNFILVIVKYSQKKNLKNLLSNFNISNKEEQNKIKENGKKEKITEDFGLPHIVIWVKETPYRSTLRDPRGKAEPTIGAGHCKSSQTRLTQWDSYSVRNIENLERKNREDMILVGVDPETFGMISQRLNNPG
ncbi:hypothetical protein U3516DRAFT_753130 [Neocallimastix sp. 'constans']